MSPDPDLNVPRRVGVVLFQDVEVLDFAGPFEVFSVAGRRQERHLFQVVTVAQRSETVLARGGLSVNPGYTLEECPPLDVLVVPGGFGTRREMHNAGLVSWIRDRSAAAEVVLSVCTGALLLARAGLLDGLDVTTHHRALDLLREAAPGGRVHPDRRILDNGHIVVAAGISAGIDASLHIVARLHGIPAANETATYMEYTPDPRGVPGRQQSVLPPAVGEAGPGGECTGGPPET